MLTKKNLNFFNGLKNSLVWINLIGNESCMAILDDFDEEGNIFITENKVTRFIYRTAILSINPVNMTNEEFEERKRRRT